MVILVLLDTFKNWFKFNFKLKLKFNFKFKLKFNFQFKLKFKFKIEAIFGDCKIEDMQKEARFLLETILHQSWNHFAKFWYFIKKILKFLKNFLSILSLIKSNGLRKKKMFIKLHFPKIASILNLNFNLNLILNLKFNLNLILNLN